MNESDILPQSEKDCEHNHLNHRERMRQKAERAGGIEFLPEHEQLEMLLFAVIPRGNTNGIAHELLNKFVNLYGVFTADKKELCSVAGVGGRTADFLCDFMSYCGIAQRAQMMGEGKTSLYLNSIEEYKDYFKSYCYKRKIETFFVVYLTTSCRVINTEVMFEGSIGEVPVYTRELVKHAVLHNAHSVVVGHNHPGGFLHPSAADIQMIDKISSALEAVDIKLLDHILCAGGHAMSFKEEGLLNRK